MKILSGHDVKRVDDFKYLCSYISSTQHDISVRIEGARATLNRLNIIWKSNLSSKLKRNIFRATVETVLVYGSVTWTLTLTLEKRVDGSYTSILRAALNKSWRVHITNKELYGIIPRITDTYMNNK